MPSALVVRTKQFAREHPLVAYGVPALAGGLLLGWFARAMDYKAYSDAVSAGWGAPKASIWGLSVGDFDSDSCDDGFAIGTTPPPVNSSLFVQGPPGCWKYEPAASGGPGGCPSGQHLCPSGQCVCENCFCPPPTSLFF